jgi:hypothetical protein
VFVRLLAEFMTGQVISFAVGDGSGVVGVGCKIMEFCESMVGALGHGLLRNLRTLNHALKFAARLSCALP